MQDEALLEKVGQNDPIIASFKKMRFGLISLLVGLGGLVGLIAGSWDFIRGKATFASNSQDFFLVFLGVLLILLAVMMFLFFYFIRNYWIAIQKARQAALQKPKEFLVEPQPITGNELFQPGEIQWKMKRRVQILYSFIFCFFFWSIFSYFINNPAFTIKHILITLISGLLFASLMTVVTRLSTRRTGTQIINITQIGITTRIAGTETFMKWEDARLFDCYRERILGQTRRAVQYELVSEQTIVRWGQPKTLALLQTEPAMDQQQFERWHEQLRGYVVGRTGLPLLELDVYTKNTKE